MFRGGVDLAALKCQHALDTPRPASARRARWRAVRRVAGQLGVGSLRTARGGAGPADRPLQPQGHRRFIHPDNLCHVSAAHPSAQQMQADSHDLLRRLEPEQDGSMASRVGVSARLTPPMLNTVLGPRLPSPINACTVASVSRKYTQPGYRHAKPVSSGVRASICILGMARALAVPLCSLRPSCNTPRSPPAFWLAAHDWPSNAGTLARSARAPAAWSPSAAHRVHDEQHQTHVQHEQGQFEAHRLFPLGSDHWNDPPSYLPKFGPK